MSAVAQHYIVQGDAARLDLMEKHGAYIEFGAANQPFYGWAYFQEGAIRPWRAGFSINGTQPLQRNFDDMREALDWVVSRMPA